MGSGIFLDEGPAECEGGDEFDRSDVQLEAGN